MTASHRFVVHDPLSPLLPSATPGSLGINNGASPDAVAEVGDTPGPLGSHDHAESLIFGGTAGPSSIQRVAKKGKAKGLAELNFVGTFEDKAKWKDDEELLEATKHGEFFPRSQELKQLAGSYGKRRRIRIIQVADFVGVLCAIIYHRPRRINVFTHGTSLNGEVVRGNVYYGSGTYDDIDAVTADATIEASGFQCGGRGTPYPAKSVRLVDIRGALPAGAQLILYGCKSGSSREQLTRIAKLLKITVCGFSKAIRFYPIARKRRGKCIKKDDGRKLSPSTDSALNSSGSLPSVGGKVTRSSDSMSPPVILVPAATQYGLQDSAQRRDRARSLKNLCWELVCLIL